jgi:hypothetical protein
MFISSSYTRTFIHLILHSNYDVRKSAYDIIRRLVNNLRSSETDISLAMLSGLDVYLDHCLPLVRNNSANEYIRSIVFLRRSMSTVRREREYCFFLFNY